MKEPPIALQEMRLAWEGCSPETPGEMQALKWLKDDPKGFRAAKLKLESEWAGQEAREVGEIEPEGAVVKWDGKGACPCCGVERVKDVGVGRAVKALERFLEETE